ncbi:MAG: hypothetical protein MJZ75_01580 [Paludibacteraceae bacterium]|nr:hypothetical protein [Paludibacteraceae bacterium]
MATTERTIQVTLPLIDARYLRRLSANMGWKIATIPTRKAATPKVKMTEEEFRAKVNASSEKAKAGHYITMLPDETGEQFIKRLCM